MLLFSSCIVADSDCDWLKKFFPSMGGDVSIIPEDCCTMNGVLCWNGLIRYMNLAKLGLTIPPGIDMAVLDEM
jgi:hypothetical protein